MQDGLRKVVHIEVFDFDSDTFAYAKESHKNQFGYTTQTKYVMGNRVVKEEPIINNVEKGAFYNRKYGLNISQMRSLRRKVRELSKNKMFPFTENDRVEVLFRGGSTISYQGEHTDDFYQKVLKLK